MAETVLSNNVVEIAGRVTAGFKLNHVLHDDRFYSCEIEVPRLSDSMDRIPVLISDKIVDVEQDYLGKLVVIKGQFRSYNKHDEGRNHLILSVFAQSFEVRAEEEEAVLMENPNDIYLEGFICRKPQYRKTPKGREIADILVAVNRRFNKSDYIPSIAWGRNARNADSFEVGDHVKVKGRIQSRIYRKYINEELHTYTAYEVSITTIEKMVEEAPAAEAPQETEIAKTTEE